VIGDDYAVEPVAEMPFGAASAKASPVIRCCRSVVPFDAATARTPRPLDSVGAPANGRRRRAPTADCVCGRTATLTHPRSLR
jgi:hypothetical protein